MDISEKLEAVLDADHEERNETLDDSNATYVLTPWGCLYGVLTEYGINVDHISGRVGTHIVEDFMDAMVEAGHVAVNGKDETV